MKILLISGHGAGDTGALGNGYEEHKLTRELVNLIAPKLRAYATVDIYDQSRNAFYDVQNGQFHIATDYNYVLEIHFNAYGSGAHGTECYVTTAEEGISVEQAIMKRMGEYFTLRDNDSVFDGVKRTDYLVIKTIKNKGMSCALLETCFIDNETDMKVYQASKEMIAADIVAGIVEGFGLKKLSEPAPEPKPAADTSFFGSKGYFSLGDVHANIGKIAAFMYKVFPAYTDKRALGNVYGSYIKASISEFQKRTGLEADGNTGPITLAKLKEYGFRY